MLSRIRSALERRRAAELEAEALVWKFGARGFEMARTHSGDECTSEERREHYRRVTRIAERRYRGLNGLDTATRYEEVARWRRRRGALLG